MIFYEGVETPEQMGRAVRWVNALLAMVRTGGTWGVPRSGSVYRVNHETRTITVVEGGEEVITRVLKAAGWNVIERSE